MRTFVKKFLSGGLSRAASRSTTMFFWKRAHRPPQEEGASMFRGLRVRLTLWYSTVLAVALVLFGTALYFGVRYLLFTPLEADLSGHAHLHMRELQASSYRACSSITFAPENIPPGPPPDAPRQVLTPELVACYDQQGTLLTAAHTDQLPNAFLDNTLAKKALQEGTATDIVDGGGTIGPIYRYAIVASSPDGTVHIMQVGMPINAQETALSVLLMLLLIFGGLALLGAGVGGLFMASRALVPARLAWTKQQRFIADASHEFRTPLTLLRADAEVLLRNRERLPADDVLLLEDIVTEANNMASLASNLLTLARLDTGSVHREHEVVSLAELAQKGARRVQALADQKGITIQVEETDIPHVIGDPTLLEQALLVLLDNAIKYNRHGGHVVVRTTEKDDQALLEVRDTGIGITAEHLPYLGERFYRVDKARSREMGGTGLGLSIARSIATTHDGTLSLSSIPDQGTTVTLALPLLHESFSDHEYEDAAQILPLPERTT